MVLSAFSMSADNTRLIKHRDMVYKVKVMFATDAPRQMERNTQASFHTEVEEVVRAVIFMVENKRPLVKIQTQSFIMVPSLKIWKTGGVLGFRQNGKELKVFSHVITLNVALREQQNEEPAPAASLESKTGQARRERGSGDPATSSDQRASPRRKQGRVQQNSNKKSASVETRDELIDRNNRSSEQKSDSQLSTSQSRVSCPTGGSAVQTLIPATTASLYADPLSQPERAVRHILTRAMAALSEAPPSRPNITTNNKPHTSKDNLLESNSTQSGAAVDMRRPSRGQKSTDGANQASPRKKTSKLSAQSGQEVQSLRSASVEGSSELPYSLRRSVQISSQSSKSPSSRLPVKKNSRTSPSNQDTQAGAVCSDRVSHSGKVGSQPERANIRVAERSRDQDSSNIDRDQETLTTLSSPGSRRRTRPPLRFAQDCLVTTRGRQNTDQGSGVGSNQLSPRSHMRKWQNRQMPVAPSQRNSARRIVLGKPIRHVHGALSSGEPQTANYYNLRQTIHRNTVMEEQRLKALMSHSVGAEQRKGGDPLTPSNVKTFEQKDRYMVETSDIQEELKLQTLANSHNVDEEEISKLRGTKRHGDLLPSLTDNVVAPVKRALRAYKKVV